MLFLSHSSTVVQSQDEEELLWEGGQPSTASYAAANNVDFGANDDSNAIASTSSSRSARAASPHSSMHHRGTAYSGAL
jgi:hypothetical protein